MENKTLNPFGLHTVTPYLIINDVQRLIDFLKQVFGAVQRGNIKYRDNGTVQHAEVVIGDTIIMLGAPTEDIPDIDSMKCGMYVYVENCDEVYETALQAGGISVSVPMDYPHGDRFAGVKDFAGNIWWIVTHIGS